MRCALEYARRIKNNKCKFALKVEEGFNNQRILKTNAHNDNLNKRKATLSLHNHIVSSLQQYLNCIKSRLKQAVLMKVKHTAYYVHYAIFKYTTYFTHIIHCI